MHDIKCIKFKHIHASNDWLSKLFNVYVNRKYSLSYQTAHKEERYITYICTIRYDTYTLIAGTSF